ncbi:MAG: condensation domain-containing protein, partial [Acidobacteriota bacterium]
METVHEFLNKLAHQGMKLSVEAGRLNCYAPKGMLTPDIREGIARHRTEIIGLIEAREGREAMYGRGPAIKCATEFPLSAGQKGLYILQKLHPAMSAYNVPLCFRIKRGLDVTLLAKAWDYVLEQYPILTARVVERDGALYQRQDAACKTTLQQEGIAVANDEELLVLLKERTQRPFDPDQGPLTRIELFSLGDAESILLLTVHHLVIDGTSAMIVLKSFLECYQHLVEGKPVRLLFDLPGYSEFVAWEEAMLASPEGQAHASYWRKQLEGELPVVELLADRPASVSAGFEGKTLVERLPEELCRWVREFGRAHSLPVSVVFLALFQMVL